MHPDQLSFERLAVQGLQVGLLGILVIGVITRNISVVINAGLAFLVTLLPSILERDFKIQLDVGLVLFVTAAVFLHALGMLGFYDTVWWWDHLTHTLSAMIVAGAGYIVVQAFDDHSSRINIPDARLPAYILGFTLAMGLLWEGVELGARIVTDALGIDVIWVNYGPGDTVLDLIFDGIGAIVVILFGTPRLHSAVDSLHAWFDERFSAKYLKQTDEHDD